MGIDAFVQFIAFAAFLVGFAGIALVVLNATRGNNVRSGVLLAAVGIVLGIVLSIAAEGIVSVGPTERVVKFNALTGNLEEPLGPGIHIVIPGIHQTTTYLVSQQSYTMSNSTNEGNVIGSDAVEARSIDGQAVNVDITVIFRVSPEFVNTLHENWSTSSEGYTDGLIRPTVRSVVRDVIARFEAENIYGGETRARIQNEIEDALQEELEPQGIEIISVLMRDVNFSQAFINAIEAKQVEEQELARAETAAQRRQTEARGLAEAAIEEARGRAESERIRAEANADVIRIEAAANADALRVVSEQIAANPNLIQYLYVQNLSDNVNVALIPSNAPFLFDASTFTQLGGDFSAPDVPELQRSNNSNSNSSSTNNDDNTDTSDNTETNTGN